jgi:hypothetical protein
MSSPTYNSGSATGKYGEVKVKKQENYAGGKYDTKKSSAPVFNVNADRGGNAVGQQSGTGNSIVSKNYAKK